MLGLPRDPIAATTLCRTDVTGVQSERGERGYSLHGVEVTERGGGNRPHISVSVAEMTDQGRYDRRADRFQDQRDLGPLLLGQRCDQTQRPQKRSDGHDPVDRQRTTCTVVDRLVRAPKISDRLREQFALPQRGKDLMEQYECEEHLEPGQKCTGRPRGGTNERRAQDVMRPGQIQHVNKAQNLREGIREEIDVDSAACARRRSHTSACRSSHRGPG